MVGYLDNIENITKENQNFRKVLYTGQHAQLVVMSLLPNEEIGAEIHETTDQFIRIEAGQGKLIIAGQEHQLVDGSAFIIPAGTEHNVINTSSENSLKLYTIYSPPHHKDQIVHQTKAEASADTQDHL